MKILVACEESQAVTVEMRKLGHEAYSCDLEPCSGGHPEWHIQVDALELLKMKWDMILAFPPCTYLSNAGAKHLFKGGQLNRERYEKGLKAKEFFMNFLKADCPRIAVENPVSSKIFEMPAYTQEIQPYQVWTCSAEENKVVAQRTAHACDSRDGCVVDPKCGCHEAGTWFMRGGRDRQKNRAKTFRGIAQAMAEQWAGKEV